MARKASPKSDKKSGTKKNAAKSRKKVSGVKGLKTQPKQQRGVDPRGVIGIVVLCIGLLALASQFIPSSGGFLNQCVLAMRGLGGMLCLLLPLVICWLGVVLVFFSEKKMSTRTLICSTLVFVFVETLLQLFQVGTIGTKMYGNAMSPNYGNFLICSYQESSSFCTGGGLIGALLAWPMVQAFDVWGSVIVLIFAITMVLMVLTGVSFSHVGMYLSEWIDDLRAEYQEHREEREAMKAAQEEEMLEQQAEMAAQRQKKREERERAQAQREQEEKARREEQEAQRILDEQVRAQAARDAQNGETADAPTQTGKGKRKVKPKTARQEPEQDDRPPLQDEPQTERRNVPRRVTPEGQAELYIERSDEFARESIEDRVDPRDARRRAQFTVEEATEAFLQGTNPDYSVYARPQPAQEQPSARETPAQEAYAPEQETAAAGQQTAPAAEADAPQYGTFYTAQYEELYQEEYEDRPDGAEETEDDGLRAPQDDLRYDSPYAPQDEEAYEDLYEQIQDRQHSVVLNRESGAEEDDDPADDQDDAVPAFLGDYFAAQQAEESRPARRRRSAAPAEGAPSSIPARGVTRRQPAQGQDVLAAQRAAVQDQTIVQLRSSRLDGTPVVLPKKDAHEAPKVTEEVYNYPPIDLLERSSSTRDPNIQAKIEAGSSKLLSTLESFGVQAKLTHVTHGPAITRYELQPAPGVKVSRIVNLVDDIALNMASDGVRIEAPIPGKPAVGIEIPNDRIETVTLREVLESPEMTREKSPTAVALGKGISGNPVVADLAKMPHVLIAGATGSGKSVCINTIITSIIYRASPKEVRLILIDPKVVELSVYNGIPHLLVPVVTDPKKASAALSWAVVEMEHRYKRFESVGVRNIAGYNKAIGPDEERMASIIVIIDELADLMMVAPGEVEESICRLAQLARAAGIHLVIATPRPSVNVITGVIKANIPSRIAFAVSSQIDSRTILDAGGAEKLLGRGDMLYAPQGGGKPTRVQGCYLSDSEVEHITGYVRGAHEVDYNEDVIEQMNSAMSEVKETGGAQQNAEPVDELLSKAIELAVEAGQVSISMIQRRLRVGYARAGSLVDEMILRGIAGEADGPTKPRPVLISREEWRRMQENEQ